MMLDSIISSVPIIHDMLHTTINSNTLPTILPSIQENTNNVNSWIDLTAQGIAATPICPAFGEPGWAPFCFLNGNPVFNAFDTFQLSIQNSIVTLHDTLQSIGIQNSYGISIILFTCLIRGVLFPVTFRQLESAEKTKALQPKIAEINEKYADDPNTKNQMVALLYQETQVNPLAGCLPAILQIPVFISLYRSFYNLAGTGSKMAEPFLWIPNLEGPVYGTRSMDWITSGWHDMIPSIGWHDTLAYLSLPILLVLAQSISLNVLTPPSDDPQVQQTQRILKYLPLIIGYFSLSVPAALGIYWLTSNVLSTVVTLGIKNYFKNNPSASFDIDLEKLANNQFSAFTNPVWGYKSSQDIYTEARLNERPDKTPRIPTDFA